MNNNSVGIIAAAVSLGHAACAFNPTREQIGTVGEAAAGTRAGKDAGTNPDREGHRPRQ